MPKIDLYQAFGLDRAAQPAELAAQLDRQLAATDPANQPVHQQITKAKAVLGDPRRRAEYDAMLAEPSARLDAADIDRIAGRSAARLTPTQRALAIVAGVTVLALIVGVGLVVALTGGGRGADETASRPTHTVYETASPSAPASSSVEGSANGVTPVGPPSGVRPAGQPVTDAFNEITIAPAPAITAPTAEQQTTCAEQYRTTGLNARLDVALTSTSTSHFGFVPPFYSQSLRTAEGAEITATCQIVNDADQARGIAPGTTKRVSYFFTVPAGSKPTQVTISGITFALN